MAPWKQSYCGVIRMHTHGRGSDSNKWYSQFIITRVYAITSVCNAFSTLLICRETAQALVDCTSTRLATVLSFDTEVDISCYPYSVDWLSVKYKTSRSKSYFWSCELMARDTQMQNHTNTCSPTAESWWRLAIYYTHGGRHRSCLGRLTWKNWTLHNIGKWIRQAYVRRVHAKISITAIL